MKGLENAWRKQVISPLEQQSDKNTIRSLEAFPEAFLSNYWAITDLGLVCKHCGAHRVDQLFSFNYQFLISRVIPLVISCIFLYLSFFISSIWY